VNKRRVGIVLSITIMLVFSSIGCIITRFLPGDSPPPQPPSPLGETSQAETANLPRAVRVAVDGGGDFTENAAYGNIYSGFCAFDHAVMTARQNNAYENGYHGFEIQENAQAFLDANAVDNNAMYAIVFIDNTSGDIINNRCAGNGQGGIGIEGAASPAVGINDCP
jgi:hypothetical protein